MVQYAHSGGGLFDALLGGMKVGVGGGEGGWVGSEERLCG